MAKASAELTPKEKSVVLGVRQGLTYAQIADYLDIGFESVRTYVARVRTKLGLANKAQLAAWAAVNLPLTDKLVKDRI